MFLLLLLALLCGMPGPAAAADIAVLMSARIDDYQEALRGFKETAGHRVVADYDMAQEFDRGRRILTEIDTKVKPDLIFAVGVWALQVVATQKSSTPVVYAMVLNPPAILATGTKNITGASMNVPVEQSLSLVRQLGPSFKRVGVIFNPAKTGYLVKQAEGVARSEGLQLVAKEVASPKEAIAALEPLAGAIDILWIVPDETVLAKAVVEQILLFSYRKKIPVLSPSERHAQMGAVFALSFASSEDIGRQAGELAQAVLGGKSPSEFPYTMVRKVSLTVNLKAAQKLGVEIPKSILQRAATVVQ